MNLRNLWNDDDAVSPVIGVILMVAITVILAAVIATFVLGLGEQVSNTAPQASFSFDYDTGAGSQTDDFGNDNSGSDDGILTITHASGATLDASNLAVRGASNSGGNLVDDGVTYSEGSEISAGDAIDVWVLDGDTVRVTWTSSTGEDSATLREWKGPDA